MARTFELAVTTTGGAGASAGSARRGVPFGRLVGLQVDYKTQPATTDVTVKAVLGGVEKTLLTLTNKNTDVPLSAIHEAGKDGAGADVGAGKNAELVPPLVGGELVATVAQGDDADPAVVVTALVEVL